MCVLASHLAPPSQPTSPTLRSKPPLIISHSHKHSLPRFRKLQTSILHFSLSPPTPAILAMPPPSYADAGRFPKRRSVSVQHSPRQQHDSWNDYSAPDSASAKKHWESTLQSLDEANMVFVALKIPTHPSRTTLRITQQQSKSRRPRSSG